MASNFIGSDLHSGQKEFIIDILGTKSMFYTLVVPRQWGKTHICQQLLLHYAINVPGCQIMWTSPVYQQANKVFKEIYNAIEESGIVEKYNRQENSIILTNKSEIYFKSVEKSDNLRGYSIDYMFCDEAAMYKDNVFNEVLRPMLRVKGKKCVLASTPKGKNFFYKLHMLSFNDENFKTYQGKNVNNPLENKEETESARKTYPSKIFKQEYEAEFIDDGGLVFDNISTICCLDKMKGFTFGDRYYAGLDLGNQEDSTCLTVFNQRGEMVDYYRKNRVGWDIIEKDILRYLKKYHPICQIEVNGLGDPIFQHLQLKYKKLIPFMTSNQSKQNIIEDLIYSFNHKDIKLPSDKVYKELTDELNTFSFEYSKDTRKVFYKAIEGFHDDCVMSLALCNNVWRYKKNVKQLEII